jgi:hypothetical protein
MPQDNDSCSVEEQHLPDETLNQGLHAVIKHSLHSSREKGFQRWCPVQSLTQVQPVPNLALVPASPPNHPLSLIGSFLISPAGEPVFGERCSPYWQLCITMVATHTKSFRYLKGAVLFKIICDIIWRHGIGLTNAYVRTYRMQNVLKKNVSVKPTWKVGIFQRNKRHLENMLFNLRNFRNN